MCIRDRAMKLFSGVKERERIALLRLLGTIGVTSSGASRLDILQMASSKDSLKEGSLREMQRMRRCPRRVRLYSRSFSKRVGWSIASPFRRGRLFGSRGVMIISRPSVWMRQRLVTVPEAVLPLRLAGKVLIEVILRLRQSAIRTVGGLLKKSKIPMGGA